MGTPHRFIPTLEVLEGREVPVRWPAPPVDLPPIRVPSIQVPPVFDIFGAPTQLWGEAGRVAIPTAAQIMLSRHGPGGRLSRCEKEALRPYFSRDLLNLTTVHYSATPLDTVKAEGFGVPFLERIRGSAAQAFGYDIYIRDSKASFSDADRLRLLAHELTHVQQYARFGGLSNFGYHYFVGYARANFRYRGNKLEQEAFTFENANADRIAASYERCLHPPTFCLTEVEGALTLRNPTAATMAYRFRWSPNDRWTSYTLKPGIARLHRVPVGCGEDVQSPEIKFDRRLAQGFQAKGYSLDYEDLPEGAASLSRNRGSVYHFKVVNNRIELFRG